MLVKHARAAVFSLFSVASCIEATASYGGEFPKCISRLEQRALDAGVSVAVIKETLGSVKEISRTLELDRKQPEFNETFANYLNKRVTSFRVSEGQKMLARYKPLLDKLTRETGVPQHYLVAFWGLETNFGGYLGTFPVIDTLATLACDERRSEFFSKEVVAALQLIDTHGLPQEQMLGSWAGAMGQTQFMPSTYLLYGVDGENDGVVNLWESIPDAMASAANFLNHLGWQRNLRWGREVRLPANFDYLNAGLKNKKSLRQWHELGLTTAFGGRLPEEDIEASLIIPAGHEGPAFLVYDNFNVIMGWNRSIFYAIAVGHLADRINGSPALHQVPPDVPRLNVSQIKALQVRLNELGFNSGKPDGIIGPATGQAIRDYQASHKMIADGYPGQDVFKALNIEVNKHP
ncbi:lytic murein transglycosylase [Candidatus Sororendozoicomonas aggregata]|uniref:lytic murein transglycosylase n=1 Tax=Candidatus Sororendozoicomonas aggregata TaxID=3073239 RepID=UPI002ED59810